ncbi:attractin 1 [Brachionus plicatilis]|uniref:Attractin 1 n=1 Tax=Brachionus plicatilis TaxID=10195 RepID=A0A3M7Q2D0_BRAPC|nr:attractin 1 [Brachionus plicatilis]
MKNTYRIQFKVIKVAKINLQYENKDSQSVTNKWSYNQTSYLSIGFGHSSHYDTRTNVIYFHGGLIPDSDRYSAYRNFDSASLSPFIYSFSLNSHTWTELTKSPEAYYMHSSVFYNNKILFYGGISQSENFQKSLSNSNRFRFYETIKNNFVEEFSIYDPENTQKFRIKFRQRFAHSVFVHENFMYIFGGFNGFWLGDMFRINLANIQEVQRVHTNFRRKRDGSKFLSNSEDFFGNKISSLNDIDFVADYEIPNEFSNRQLSQIEMCSSHMNCNSCQLNSNCIWNGNICEYFTSIDLTPCSALHSNCSSCITDERCGWCTKDTQGDGTLNTGFGKCLEGGELKSLNKECEDNWFFSSCPSCECNGHSTCSNSSACTKCMNNTQGPYCSECKFGFFGKAKNNGLCESCECGEQASDCDKSNGRCFCDTKGVIGDKCDACDSPRYFGRPNMTEGSCYYNLTTDYQFTFNLNKDSDRYLTKINFVNHPTRGSDDDIDFMIRCYRTTAVVDVSFVIEDFSYSSYDSFVVPDYNQNALSIEFLSNFSLALKNSTWPTTTDESSNQQNSLVFDISKFYFGRMPKFNKILTKVNCSNEEFKHTFTNNELNYADEHRNLLFIVNAYSFKTPITIQIAFSRKTKIHLLHFFITFFGCLLSLLTIAFITWKSKQRLDRYRRQRQIVIQMEHMASRPFTRLFLDISEGSKEEAGCSKLENQEPVKEKKASRLSFKKSEKKAKFLKSLEFEAEVENGGDSHPKVMPIGVEPLSNNKSAIVTCLLRLPQGGSKSIPKGSSLFMLGSTYINLNSSSNVVPHGPSDIQMNNDESDDEQEAEKNFINRFYKKFIKFLIPCRILKLPMNQVHPSHPNSPFTGKNTNNRYFIKSAEGNQIYMASEDTEICMRTCCGDKRGFQIFILDKMNQQVMKMSREFKFFAQSSLFAGLCDLCAHEVTVEAPVGTVVGYVKQKGSFQSAHYDILDENQEPVLKVRGPFCIYDGPCCPCENEFQILSLSGSQIGKLSKEYAVPIDLSVKTKATLIGCLFLIDFMYFEKKQDKKKSKDDNRIFKY